MRVYWNRTDNQERNFGITISVMVCGMALFTVALLMVPPYETYTCTDYDVSSCTTAEDFQGHYSQNEERGIYFGEIEFNEHGTEMTLTREGYGDKIILLCKEPWNYKTCSTERTPELQALLDEHWDEINAVKEKAEQNRKEKEAMQMEGYQRFSDARWFPDKLECERNGGSFEVINIGTNGSHVSTQKCTYPEQEPSIKLKQRNWSDNATSVELGINGTWALYSDCKPDVFDVTTCTFEKMID